MRDTSTDLFSLIKSLSGPEKRYFKNFAALKGGDTSNYVELFDAICGLKQYDEPALKKHFKNTPVGRQFRYYKNYLLQEIGHALYHFNAANDEQSTLFQQAKIAEIYVNRNLLPLAEKQIKQIRKKATDNNVLVPLMVLEYAETDLALKTGPIARIDAQITRGRQNMDEVLHLLQLESNSYTLALETLSFIRKVGTVLSPKVQHEAEHLLNKLLAYPDNLRMSIKAWRNLINCRAILLSKLNRHEEALNYRKMLVDEMQKRKFVKANEYKLYLSYVHNYQISLQRVGKVDTAIEDGYKLLELVNSKTFDKPELWDARNRSRAHAYNMLISCLVDSGKFTEGDNLVDEVITMYKTGYDSFQPFEQLVFMGNFSQSLYRRKKFEEAAYWCRSILDKTADNYRHDINRSARMMLVVCLYEMGDIIHLEYVLRNVFRQLKEKKEISKTEILLEHIIRTLLSRKNVQAKLKLHLQELVLLKAEAEEQPIIALLEVETWLQDKIIRKVL
jgi:pentatricopeptide repeat protein